MALFKIFKGNSTNLPLGTKYQLTGKSLPYQEGFAYFTPDTGRFYIDAGNERIALNAGNISFAQASSTNTDGSNLNICIGSDLSRNPRVWVPAATATLSGLLTAADQTINGEKTFKSRIIAESGLSSGGSIGPSTNNTYALGSPTNFWSAIYASDIYGKFAVGRNLKVNLASTSAAAFDGSADVTGIGVTGTLPVTNGGTGKTSWSQYRLVYASGQTTLASLSSGTAGQVLQSGGGTQSPRWVNQASLAAGTAEQFASAQVVELSGDVSGSVSSQAGWSLATTLANSGITAGSYGPATNASPTHGGSFSVPYITFDAKGRATAAYTRTITLPTYSIGNAKITIAAGSGLATGGDFTVNQTSAKTITINHSNAITAGSVGTAQSPSHGGTFAIPKITYDAQGHITAATTVNITLPSDNNTHYQANLLWGDSAAATSSPTIAVTDPYLILRENNTNRSGIQFVGSGATVVYGYNGQIVINSSYSTATQSRNGLMSTTDKIKLDKIAEEANNYTLPNASSSTKGGVIIGSNISVSSGTISLTKSNVTTALGYTPDTPAQVDAKIAALVNGAPGALDTLNELATALGNDASFATKVINSIGAKQDTITGAASTITSSNLTANRALISNGSGKVVESAVTSTELGYLDGVTSNIQTQLNNCILGRDRAAFNANTLYDAGVYLISAGSNCPSGNQYGSLLMMPYRKLTGNTTPDFGVQIFIPNGDDTTKPNSMFFRTSLSGSWNSWQEVATVGHTHSYVPTSRTINGKALSSNISLDASDVGAAPASHGTHLSLGTTSSTAFRGDYGNIAYTHSQSTHAPTNAQKNSDITKSEIEAKLTGNITTHTHSAYAEVNHGTHVTTATVKSALGTGSGTTRFLREDGNWAAPPSNNTSYSTMTGATSSTAGAAGLVPAPAAGKQTSFLRGDGSWVIPTNTDTKVTTTMQSSSVIYVTGCTGTTTGTLEYNSSVYISRSVLYGACWNDYAEYRQTKENIEGGRVVIENGDDTLSLSSERLAPGANIVSDTFGFAIGETEISKTPLAVSGRVLAYPYEDRGSYKPGDPVCSGPNGTVSKMTREEVMMYPDRILGTVSAIPNYETWGTGNVAVNGRIWIKI